MDVASQRFKDKPWRMGGWEISWEGKVGGGDRLGREKYERDSDQLWRGVYISIVFEESFALN